MLSAIAASSLCNAARRLVNSCCCNSINDITSGSSRRACNNAGNTIACRPSRSACSRALLRGVAQLLAAQRIALGAAVDGIHQQQHLPGADPVPLMHLNLRHHAAARVLYRLAVTGHHHAAGNRHALIQRRQQPPQQEAAKSQQHQPAAEPQMTPFVELSGKGVDIAGDHTLIAHTFRSPLAVLAKLA